MSDPLILTNRVFTILLLYPENVAGSYGETFMTHASVLYDPADPAASVRAAVAEARQQMLAALGTSDDPADEEDPATFAVVAVIEGEHRDLAHLL
jgi:hypothetical protein